MSGPGLLLCFACSPNGTNGTVDTSLELCEVSLSIHPCNTVVRPVFLRLIYDLRTDSICEALRSLLQDFKNEGSICSQLGRKGQGGGPAVQRNKQTKGTPCKSQKQGKLTAKKQSKTRNIYSVCIYIYGICIVYLVLYILVQYLFQVETSSNRI